MAALSLGERRNMDMDDKRDLVRALTLRERYEALEKVCADVFTDFEALERWRNRKGLLKEDSYTQILESMGYKENIFSQAIQNENPKHLEAYYETIKGISIFGTIEDVFSIIGSDNQEYKREYSMGYLVRPFLILFERKFLEQFRGYKINMEYEKIWEQLNLNLNSKLVQMALKTFILEINLFKENNFIEGETEQDRYHFIVKSLGERENLTELYKKYMVLTREMCECVNMFVVNIQDIFAHLESNAQLIDEEFHMCSETLTEVKFDLGDTHQRGKSVLILRYLSGKKLVYKPKNLKIVEAYNKLIEYINKDSNLLELPTLRVKAFEDWCLEEFVEHNACSTREEIARYYYRLGESAAVMYMLRGNDFHMENIVANGEYPYFIDIETLLNNTVEIDYQYQAVRSAVNRMGDDVSNTSLLPAQNYIIQNGVGMDLSGMNGSGQDVPIDILQPVNLNTDNIRFDYKKAKVPAANNLPILEDKAEGCFEYLNEFIAGFRKTCEFFMENRDKLLTDIYPLFLGKTVRVLVRNTRNYGSVIDALKHPRYLKQYLEKEKVLENTWAFGIKNREICCSEYLDMRNNDIPVFFTEVGSKDLEDSTGRIYKDYFADSAYHLIVAKLKKLDAKEIERQVQIIKLYTGSEEKKTEAHQEMALEDFLESDETGREIFLQRAENIADMIWEQAMVSEEDDSVSWLHLPYTSQNKLQIMDGSLYNGLSGIALFYYYLYKITGKERYQKAYKMTLKSTIKMVYGLRDEGVLTGKASLLYLLYKIITEEKDYCYKDELDRIIKYIDEILKPGKAYDWINGYTGILHVMLLIYEEFSDQKDAMLCYKLADMIVEAIKEVDEKKLYGGFAHGVTAVALTMFQAAKVLESDEYEEYGNYLLKIDRSYYDAETGEWLSHDEEDDKMIVRHHWCHGAVGIGLSRLEMSGLIQDSGFDAEIDAICTSLRNSQINKAEILCHGNAGMCDFLLEAYEHKKDKTLLLMAENLLEYAGKNFIAGYEENPIKQSMGIFNGLAGIGYEYLRLASPEIVPSVLILE